MKEITLQIPDGKRAEWINGVFTLVDEPKVDNRPVTERIKTFEDACNALGDEHPFVKEYWGVVNIGLDIAQDLIAYLKLRIIVIALNEGWEPQFTADEYRYYPWFWLYTKDKYEEMDKDNKQHCILRSSNNMFLYCGFVNVVTYNNTSFSNGYNGSLLAFRTHELAAYAGRQFTEELADFMVKPRTDDELKEN